MTHYHCTSPYLLLVLVLCSSKNTDEEYQESRHISEF